MKKLTLLLCTVSTVLLASEIPPELQWIQKQIDDIKQTRQGVPVRKISLLKDPFIFLEKNKTPKPEDKKKKSSSSVASASAVVPQSVTNAQAVVVKPTAKKSTALELHAIMNNSVLINSKWYKKGEVVHGYMITHITLKDVTLKKGSKTKTLTIKSHRMSK